jgi:hypothetical protein
MGWLLIDTPTATTLAMLGGERYTVNSVLSAYRKNGRAFPSRALPFPPLPWQLRFRAGAFAGKVCERACPKSSCEARRVNGITAHFLPDVSPPTAGRSVPGATPLRTQKGLAGTINRSRPRGPGSVCTWSRLQVDGLALVSRRFFLRQPPLLHGGRRLWLPGRGPSTNPRALTRRAATGGTSHLRLNSFRESRKVLRQFLCNFRERAGRLPQFSGDGI